MTTPGELDRLVHRAAQEAFDAVNAQPAEGTGLAPETPVEGTTAAPAPTGSHPEGSTEAQNEGTVDMSPYFGIDPTGIPAEKWAEVLDHLRRQDSTIGRLNQRLASRRRLEAQEDAPIRDAARSAYDEVTTRRLEPSPASEDEGLTASVQSLDPSKIADDDFVKALGLETELLEPKVVEAIGTLAREALTAKKAAAEAAARVEEEEAVRFWNSSLDELEAQFGRFPEDWDRQSVLQYAVDESIATPYELYFRLTAVAKSEVDAAVREARQSAIIERLKQEQAGGLRPTSVASGDVPDEVDAHNLKRAVAQGLRMAERKHGTTLTDAVKSRILHRD